MSEFEIREGLAAGGIRTFRVSGDVDFGVAPELKKRIISRIDAGDRRIVVDLTSTGFVDSTAIGVLVGALKRLRDHGGSLAVVCDNEEVRNIFAVVGLENVIPLHRSEADALAVLAGTA
ncbi:MAG TPA: STAS domain-containing protein [Solirubrobacteraceae bacterium]|nr:STAS domain-containing protein [Solirubrobacteraceae bacterium]